MRSSSFLERFVIFKMRLLSAVDVITHFQAFGEHSNDYAYFPGKIKIFVHLV